MFENVAAPKTISGKPIGPISLYSHINHGNLNSKLIVAYQRETVDRLVLLDIRDRVQWRECKDRLGRAERHGHV